MECRLCLQNEPSVFIFDETKTIPKKIWDCCQIMIESDDGLPNYICLSCEMKLDSFSEFKYICAESLNFLKGKYEEIDVKFNYPDNTISSKEDASQLSELPRNELFSVKKEPPSDGEVAVEAETFEKKVLNKSTSKLRKYKRRCVFSKRKTTCDLCGKIIPSTIKRHMLRAHSFITVQNVENDECLISSKMMKTSIFDNKVEVKRKHTRKNSVYNTIESSALDVVDDKAKTKRKNEEKCDICGKILFSSVRRHISNVHTDHNENSNKTQLLVRKKKLCNICGKMFTYNLKRHIFKMHQGAEYDYKNAFTEYECCICNENFEDVVYIKTHFKVVHNTKLQYSRGKWL